MLQLYGKIEGETYIKLVSYLVNECDKLSFCVYNYESRLNQDEYIQDIENCFPEIKKNLIKKYKSRAHGYQAGSVLRTIYELEANSETLNMLLKKNSLYDWQSPNNPEDIAFYYFGTLIFECIAHESYSLVYTEEQNIIGFIKNLNIDMNEY